MRTLLFITLSSILFSCGRQPSSAHQGAEVNSVEFVKNGLCEYEVFSIPTLSTNFKYAISYFVDSCNKFKVGDKIYMTITPPPIDSLNKKSE